MKMGSKKEGWDKFWKTGDVGVTPARRQLFKTFQEISLPEKARILDVGCGSGTLAHFWKEYRYDVIGLDISDKSLEITRRKGVAVVRGDATRLPFNDGSFDLVYSDGLLEHFIKPNPILEEIFRVGKKYIITLVPRNTLYNFIHNIILRPPKEYKRKDLEWVRLHEELNPKSIEFKKVMFGVLLILCERERAGAKD